MRHVMVRYQVKPDQVGENERLVRAVFTALDRDKPEGVHYSTLKLADGVGFVHFAVITAADNPLPKVDAFREFTATIKDRCVEPPVVTELEPIGAYRMLPA